MLMIAQGCPAIKIAEILGLSNKTVNTYRYRVFEKLGIRNNVEMTHLAVRAGLISANC